MKIQHHIAVFLGGPSAEREVSLRSGAAVAEALRSAGHIVMECDPTPGQWQLPPQTDVAFLALHGTYGEDGAIQEELEQRGVPYTGCGIEASRLAFDKRLAKQRFLSAGVPTPRFHTLTPENPDWPDESWQPPVVLKPARQGSSVGLQFVDRLEAFPAALAHCLAHDQRVLMEERIVGRETTVGILGDVILPIVEVIPREGAYDYQNKYTPGRTDYYCPADFDFPTTHRIQQTAWNAFQSIGGRDYARVDVMVGATGAPFVLEVNTLPGMTATSLLPKAAAALGISFVQLCERMLEMALMRSSKNGGPA